MESYPLIKIPNKLNNIQNLLPPSLEMPKRPGYPEKPADPPPPIKNPPKEPCYEEINFGWAWIFIGLGIVLFLIIGHSDKPTGPLGAIAFFSFLIGSIAVYYGITENPKRKEAFNKKKREYPDLLRQYELNFQKELDKHSLDVVNNERFYQFRLRNYKELEIPLYTKELDIYNNQTNLIRSKENIHTFRKEKLNEYLSTIKRPGIHPSNKDVKRGVSEIFFYNHLISEFKGNIYQNFTINFKNSLKHYLPDFTYYDHNNGLCIDIEIDEPYVGSNGTPIHYVGSNDDNRDNFFLENSWIVIRFAEEQVINAPLKCIKVIQEVISNVLLLADGLDKTKITPIKRWTKEEAHQMAFKRIRNTYLGITLSEKLESEDHEMPEMFQAIPETRVINKPTPQPKNHITAKSTHKSSYLHYNENDQEDLPF